MLDDSIGNDRVFGATNPFQSRDRRNVLHAGDTLKFIRGLHATCMEVAQIADAESQAKTSDDTPNHSKKFRERDARSARWQGERSNACIRGDIVTLLRDDSQS